ncbi:MAG: spore coat protein U domain-containing protein [Oligoflexia bacterium]|nr:spore coat protein U domain-containing protein [Oligoflexia bacterium]
MRNAIFVVIGLVFWLGATNAHGACGLTLTANNVSLTWDMNFTAVAVQFTLDKANEPACNFAIGFSKGGGADYNNRRATTGAKNIKYQLHTDSGLTKILKTVPDVASADNVIMGGFPAGTNLTQTLTYYLDIPYGNATSPTLVGSGSFTDTYAVEVFETSVPPVPTDVPVTSSNVNLTITVNPMIKLSLVSTGGGFDAALNSRSVDFGNLYQGATSQFDLRVRTNAGYSITFSSGYNGNLKPGAASGSNVPYSFYVNGVLLDMSNSAAVPVVGLSGAGQTTLSGLAYPIKTIVGSLAGAGIQAGLHQDTVTITATTTE